MEWRSSSGPTAQGAPTIKLYFNSNQTSKRRVLVNNSRFFDETMTRDRSDASLTNSSKSQSSITSSTY